MRLHSAGLLAILLVTAGCGGSGRDEVLVSAAASLTDAFADIEAAFEQANPDVDVFLNVAGSAALREQIIAGAPAGVFAAADTANMDRVVSAGLVSGEPRIFARNLLEIAVPPGNPAGVTGLGDFGDDALLIGLCAAAVPCGALARLALDGAAVTPAVDTDEPNVRALLTKIAAGELDAGIVYVTDVRAAAGSVDGIAVGDAGNVAAEYSIAALAGASRPAAAGAFVDFVLSAAGQAILARHGFGAP